MHLKGTLFNFQIVTCTVLKQIAKTNTDIRTNIYNPHSWFLTSWEKSSLPRMWCKTT